MQIFVQRWVWNGKYTTQSYPCLTIQLVTAFTNIELENKMMPSRAAPKLANIINASGQTFPGLCSIPARLENIFFFFN